MAFNWRMGKRSPAYYTKGLVGNPFCVMFCTKSMSCVSAILLGEIYIIIKVLYKVKAVKF